MTRPVQRFLSICLSLILGPVAFASDPVPERVYILANAVVPESIGIAEYYAQARAIPEANIVRLDMPAKETISARAFIDSIYNPLIHALADRGAIRAKFLNKKDNIGRDDLIVTRNRVDFLVTTYGVPLRFRNDKAIFDTEKSGAQRHLNQVHGAVDAELALIPTVGNLLTGPIPNPLFSQYQPGIGLLNQVIRVTRLDGPSSDHALHMIDDAIEAEESGLWGRAWVDVGGPHAAGDSWLNETIAILKKTHWPVSEFPTKKRFPVTTPSDGLALYFGWYTTFADGVFGEPEFEFLPGAIAFHIHSSSATSLRDPRRWTPALIERGVAGTVGNVYEPYLGTTHQPHLMINALLGGKSWGEASYVSIRSLGWQSIVIGDPLYRPFKNGVEPNWELPYSMLRLFTKLQNDGAGLEQFVEAEKNYTGPKPTPVIDLFMSRLFIENGKRDQARERLTPYTRELHGLDGSFASQRLAAEIAQALFDAGDTQAALEVFDRVVTSAQEHPSLLPTVASQALRIAEQYVDMERISRWRPLTESPPAFKSGQ